MRKGSLNKKDKKDEVKKKVSFQKKKRVDFRKILTKKNVIYLVLFLIDIILVIYSARKNIVNYVTIYEQDIFVSKTRYLLMGRNYITLVITIFFFGYICFLNKFFFKSKNTKKFMFWLFVILFLLNTILFFIFTKRIY